MSHDTYTKEGAERIATTVRDYWRERGYEVKVEVCDRNARFFASLRERCFTVRSNLVDGLPRDYDPKERPL